MGASQPPAVDDEDGAVVAARSFLSAAELLVDPPLARVYTDVLLNQPTSNTGIADRLDLPASTTSKRVGRLKELGIVEDTSTGKASQLVTDPIAFTVSLEAGTVTVTPTIIAVFGATEQVDDIDRFLDRHGPATLVEAVGYTTDYLTGDLTRRGVGEELGIEAVEAIAITQAIEPIVAILSTVDEDAPELAHDVHERKLRTAPYTLPNDE